MMSNMRYKVMAADDETELLDVLSLYFEKENMNFIKAKDGREAFALFQQETPDLVMLDVMMPYMDGYEVLKNIRASSKIPAIMVTARIQDYDKILGLELGADDYITKPYNPLEVVARVKAHLRRNYDYISNGGRQDCSREIAGRDLLLKPDDGAVQKDGKEIILTATEIHILELLMTNPGRVFTKRQIFNQVWDECYLGDDNTIMVHISNLRKKIENDSSHRPYIKTIKGLGYKFD